MDEQIVPLDGKTQFIYELYEGLLGRKPAEKELQHWVTTVNSSMTEREILHRFITGPEYRRRNRIKPGHALGHFYSPIVDPSEVKDYWRASKSQQVSDLAGLKIDLDAMADFWKTNLEVLKSAPFEQEANRRTRYHYNCGFYPKGDALVLMAMINTYRPARIIEIGSGFSTAVMLDTADHLGLHNMTLTCIEPYADRLKERLRPEDQSRTLIIEAPVQHVSLNTFAALEANDILFIDSSHVLKTGSDVHFELFSILPTLKSGVIVHFHDIQFPFEYPAGWVFHNAWSWNEIYAVRAFLMYNERFKIEFFTDYFLNAKLDLVAELGSTTEVIGGSLWVSVQ